LDRRTLKPFAQLVQIVSIASIGLCLWEVAHPELIEIIAKTRHEGATAYDVLRPAALWSNPDEAASSLLFALLLARWAGGPLAWLGRISAVIGIYLGASRTGAYLLLICGLVYAAFWLRTVRIDSARLAAFVGSLLIVGAAAVVAVIQLGFDPSEQRQFARILDFTEAKASAAGGSRLDIAGEAAETILAGPWHGYGLFTFQLYALEGVREVLETPAHNIYLTVWGETGPLIALAYVFVLGMGLRQVFRVRLLLADRIPILLMWFCYLVIGLTWHNQFTSFAGMIFIGLLYHLPSILRIPPDSSGGTREVIVRVRDAQAFTNAPQAVSHREESILLPGVLSRR
jgi:O-antigen ligase